MRQKSGIWQRDFCLIVDGDIKVCKKEVEERGGTIELGLVPRNGALGPMQSIYLRDPDGNLVELASYDSIKPAENIWH